MNQNLYYEHLNFVLDRKEIPEILALWRESIYLGSFGAITRAIITKQIPALAKHYDINVNKEASFEEFLKVYYEKLYSQRCSNRGPLACVEYFAANGDRRSLKLAMGKAAPYLDRDVLHSLPYKTNEDKRAFDDSYTMRLLAITNAWHGAIRGRNFDNIKFLVENYADHSSVSLESALASAVEANDLEMAQLLLEAGAQQAPEMLVDAAKNGNKDMIKLLVEYGNTHWYYGQRGAREGGHEDLRKFFSRKLAGLEATL